MLLTAFICLLFLVSPVLSQDSVVERHERFLSYLPEGSYTSILYINLSAIRAAGIVRDHPELFGVVKTNVGLPFPEVEADYRYSATPFSAGKSIREVRKAKASGERGSRITVIGPADQMSVVEIPGLVMHIEEALKSGKIFSSGEHIGGAAVYTTEQILLDERKTIYFCSPEQDLALICGSTDLLRAMVHAGRGEQPSFVESSSYGDLIQYAGDSAQWNIRLMNDMFNSFETAYIERGEEPARIDAMERMRSMRPIAIVNRQEYFEEEYRSTIELIFVDEEAAEKHLQVRINPKFAIATPIENFHPQEMLDFNKKVSSRMPLHRDGNRVISGSVYTAEDLAEHKRLFEKHAEFYKNVSEKIKKGEVSKPEIKRKR